MSNRQYSLTDLILDNLFNMRGLISRSCSLDYMLAKKQDEISNREFRQAISRMQSRKLLAITEKDNQKFIKLTNRGQLEALLQKAKLENRLPWDGKWRLFIFDIPEANKDKRDFLRGLLKKNNFCKLQASVYVSPYPLNREAISYLNQSGLRDYLRILKVEEMDNDRELLKKFGLKKKSQ